MTVNRYGTEFERYKTTGIVPISHLKLHLQSNSNNADIGYRDKKRNNLEKYFKSNPCLPWKPENHIKVEVSKEEWAKIEESRQGSKKLEDNIEYPCYSVDRCSNLTILRGVTRIEVISSSRAAKLNQLFNGLEPSSRWWVVDFIIRESASDSDPASKSRHFGARQILTAIESHTEVPYIHSLKPDLNKSIQLVGRTEYFSASFSQLAHFEPMWPTLSLGLFDTIRKTWCNEEALNYLNYVHNQWKEITLEWEKRVVDSMDHKSVNMLQSRAPLFSLADRNYIIEKFETREIFPKIFDQALRKEIESAVCKQRLILTLHTFSKDVRILHRIHKPLKVFLVNMKRDQGDTLRKRVQKFFQEEFDGFYDGKDGERLTCNIEKEKAKNNFAKDCYQQLFLYAMRNQCHSICRPNLKTLATHHLERIANTNGLQMISTSNPALEDITMESPLSPTLVSCSDADYHSDVAIKSRHGVNLLRSELPKSMLYLRNVRQPHKAQIPISWSFLQREILCIFLFGAPPLVEKTDVSPVSERPTTDTLYRFPFCDGRSELDTHSYNNNDSPWISSGDEFEDNQNYIQSVPCYKNSTIEEPQTKMSSEVASIRDLSLSPAMSTIRPLNLAKRGLPQDDTSMEMSARKRRQCDWSAKLSLRERSGTTPFSPEDQSSPDRYQHPVSAHALAPLSLADVVETSPNRKVPLLSPSLEIPPLEIPPRVVSDSYSPSEYSQEADDVTVCFNGASPNTYEQNLHTIGHTHTISSFNIPTQDNGPDQQVVPQLCELSQMWTSTNDRNPDITQTRSDLPLIIRHSSFGNDIQTNLSPTVDQPHVVIFQSTLKKEVNYRTVVDEDFINRFVISQKRLDPKSTFWYAVEPPDSSSVSGFFLKNAPRYQELYFAIKKYSLKTVFVHSSKLGSTEDTVGSAPLYWRI